jgi:outer membrane receptor for ferrienterochelin and colicin
VSKIYVLIIACLLTAFCTNAQTGKLAGKILNDKNEPLAGVSVKITGSQGGTTTDVEGRFTLTLSTGKKYELTFSAVGYGTKTIDEVEVTPGQVTDLNVSLVAAGKNLNAVTVTANRSNARKESTVSLIQFQKNTNTVAAVVSAEAIRRSPDKNTGEVLKRVPGVSVQDGRYLVVRGLSDRYNQAMLNGILLSSTEPDRKTFSFDIFPASVIDNIIINKAFVPEYPGEWAGGLVQVNTKEIPSQNYFNIQVGTGFNTNVIGRDFYKYKGSNLDWLGFDNKTRALPDGMPTKTGWQNSSTEEKADLASKFPNNWAIQKKSAQPNASLQASGGFASDLFGKKVGGTLAVTYNRSIKHYDYENSFAIVDPNSKHYSSDFIYNTDKYAEEVLLGAMANFSILLNNNHKISVKNLFNVNSTNYTSIRSGIEYLSVQDSIKAKELAMRTNIFYNTQILGEHNMPGLGLKFNWFGSFNILDQYIPAQRRSDYLRNAATGLYEARISQGQSQKAGSYFYSNLSDYIYTAGGDLTKTFEMFGNKQTVKGGYFFQVKDRLYDARPFYVKLNDNSIKTQPEEQFFNPDNFTSGKLTMDEFIGNQYRYLANSILNAGYLQFDNSFTNNLRVVWGLRIEDFDQLVGSVKQSDNRHVHTRVTDYLPALNITYKVTPTNNFRLSGSQTVIRPEFRELSNFSFYDFELGASVLGNTGLKRTKVSNADIRYEIYPRAGELFTLGAFYKYFEMPIELLFNQSGAGSSNTFNYQNADKASGFGVEFEMRKKLDFVSSLKNFTFTTNLSYIHNRVKFPNHDLDRPMQGQSPYLINASLQYDVEKLGLTSTLLFNQIGRRIAFVGNGKEVPHIWEAPRPLLDLQVAKKVIKGKGEVKLNVSDIVNKKANFYQDVNDDGKYNKGTDALVIRKIYGTTFSITFGYNF